MSAAVQELKSYFQEKIKNELLTLVREYGDFMLNLTSRTAAVLDGAMYKHGLEVYGMAVQPDQIEITFELGENYLQIPNLPIRYCRITFGNDGNYHADLDKNELEDDLQISFDTSIYNFSKCSEDEKQWLVDEIKKVHLLYFLSRLN